MTGYGVLSAYLLGLVGVFGLVVGSFLNVVVYRVPAGLSVVNPPSACPGCGHRVRARDNVPVLSWLLLRGRCRDCATPISIRYPAVEAGTAAAFVAVAWYFSDPVVVAAGLVLAAAGIAQSLIDIDHHRLPFAITGVTAVLVLLVAVVGSLTGVASYSWTTLALSAGLWCAPYLALRLVGRFVLRRRAMGFGDIALAPVLGFVVGLVGLGASVVGLMAGMWLLTILLGPLRFTGRIPRWTRVPYGPFLIAGAAVGLAFGPAIATWYGQFL